MNNIFRLKIEKIKFFIIKFLIYQILDFNILRNLLGSVFPFHLFLCCPITKIETKTQAWQQEKFGKTNFFKHQSLVNKLNCFNFLSYYKQSLSIYRVLPSIGLSVFLSIVRKTQDLSCLVINRKTGTKKAKTEWVYRQRYFFAL